MDDIPHEPVVWRFVRANFVRIVIGVVLASAIYGVLCVWMPYKREQRIVRKIDSLGGYIKFQDCGPSWATSTGLFYRIAEVNLQVNRRGKAVPTDLYSDLGSLRNLCELNLQDTQLTDAELEHLKVLTSLQVLRLENTQVTDIGLQHLKGMKNLHYLGLQRTQTSDVGLQHLEGLTNLSELRLDRTKVTDAGLEHLKGLKRLKGINLSYTQITDIGLEHLKSLQSLKGLDLGHTKVTPEGRASLRKELHGCLIMPVP